MDLAFISSRVCYVYLCLWRQLKLNLSILPAMWQVNHMLGFCTGIHHRQKGKGGKRQEEPVRRIEGEAAASPGQSSFTKSHFGWLELAGEGTSLWGLHRVWGFGSVLEVHQWNWLWHKEMKSNSKGQSCKRSNRKIKWWEEESTSECWQAEN